MNPKHKEREEKHAKEYSTEMVKSPATQTQKKGTMQRETVKKPSKRAEWEVLTREYTVKLEYFFSKFIFPT